MIPEGSTFFNYDGGEMCRVHLFSILQLPSLLT
jgi:hypothetical protein